MSAVLSLTQLTDANEYHDFKDSQGNDIWPILGRLLNLIRSLPISTAECKPGFSRMNFMYTSSACSHNSPHLCYLFRLWAHH